MDFTDFKTGTNDSGRRLDKILKHIFQDTHTTNIYAAIRKKLIKVNGLKTSADYQVTEGDVISVAKFLLEHTYQDETRKKTQVKHQIILQTIFKNQHILIINKPYGINVHSSKSEETDIASIIARQYRDSSSISFTPAPLHRLDKYTTGVLAVSQTHEGAVWFSSAIASHEIKKTYIGIAEGILNERVTWEDSIENKHHVNKSFHTVSIAESPFTICNTKKSITHATPLAYGVYKGKPITLVQYNIETGRKHQIRIQTSTHGHPLLGDSAYNSLMCINTPIPYSFFLHAIQISIPKENPLSLPCTIKAPLPEEFETFMQFSLLKWDKKLII